MKLKISVLLLLISFASEAQFFLPKKRTFTSTKEYTTYLNKKFGFAPEEVYFLSPESNMMNLVMPASETSLSILFIEGNQMTSIEDVMPSFGYNVRSVKNFFKIVTVDIIRKSFVENEYLSHVNFINLGNNALYVKNDSKMYAVFFFTYEAGKLGTKFIKHRKKLKKLGIDAIILSLDERAIKQKFKNYSYD